MKIDVSGEIFFKTARSGGKGGQNVNKVETMVEGYLAVGQSSFFSQEQKDRLFRKLANRINAEGMLKVKSQIHRSQLANKQEVVKKMNQLIELALKKEKKRIATRPSKISKEKRIGAKKIQAQIKDGRKKIRLPDN